MSTVSKFLAVLLVEENAGNVDKTFTFNDTSLICVEEVSLDGTDVKVLVSG